jgi:hypothetical protein
MVYTIKAQIHQNVSFLKLHQVSLDLVNNMRQVLPETLPKKQKFI